MVPKNRVMNPIKFRLSVLDDFPTENRLKTAVIRMVIGIRNSTKAGLIIIIPNTESSNASVCPMVKMVTKSNIFFQSLNECGMVKAIKNKK